MELIRQAPGPSKLAPDMIKVGESWAPVFLVRNPRARHYILRVQDNGSVRVTIPRWGTLKEGRAFAREKAGWIEKQIDFAKNNPPQRPQWKHGYSIYYRGQLVEIKVECNPAHHLIRVEDQRILTKLLPGDLRPLIERHLRKAAVDELTERTIMLSKQHELAIQRVTVRDQRTRWGSCSSRGNISLNWRLIQTPDWVRDYIIVHELMHLRHMNHSKRYWKQVEKAYPQYKEAEAWLKKKSELLRR